MEIKKGLKFFHARVLDTQKFDGYTPALYEVTRIAQGVVYYRPVFDVCLPSQRLGRPEYDTIEHFPKIVKSLYTPAVQS